MRSSLHKEAEATEPKSQAQAKKGVYELGCWLWGVEQECPTIGEEANRYEGGFRLVSL